MVTGYAVQSTPILQHLDYKSQYPIGNTKIVLVVIANGPCVHAKFVSWKEEVVCTLMLSKRIEWGVFLGGCPKTHPTLFFLTSLACTKEVSLLARRLWLC